MPVGDNAPNPHLGVSTSIRCEKRETNNHIEDSAAERNTLCDKQVDLGHNLVARSTSNASKIAGCFLSPVTTSPTLPGAEGWFETADRFVIRNEMLESISFDQLCSTIMQCDFSFLLFG